MKILGIILLLLGGFSLVYGGINYRQRHTLVQIGDVKATATENKSIAIPPWAGVVLVVAGIGMVVMDSRRGSRA